MTSIILVATYKKRTWVIKDADSDLNWEFQAREHIAKPASKFSWDRGMALLLAHNIQRKKPHDFGVWEVFLKDEKWKMKEKTSDNVSSDNTRTTAAKHHCPPSDGKKS